MQPALSINSLALSIADGPRQFQVEAAGLHIMPGRAAAVTGRSGSGKTLFLEAMGLIRRPDPGADVVAQLGSDTVSLMALWETRRPQRALAAMRRRAYGFVPQLGGLLPFLSVRENLVVTQQLSGREDAEFAEALLNILGLAHRAHLRPGALSGGERQRLAIGRAMAHRPQILIADEPTASVDPALAKEVMDSLVNLTRQAGIALLISTHDRALAQACGIHIWACRPLRTDDPNRARVQITQAEA